LSEVKLIPIEKLIDSPNNFFRALTDEELAELSHSIKSLGILHPLVVRPLPDGNFEIISGHQRKKAAKIAGLTKVPCIVKDVDDVTAELILIDTNTKTRQLSPMEMARSVRRVKELIGISQGVRNASATAAEVAESMGMSERSMRLYDKLNNLIPELQQITDEGGLSLNSAERLAGLPQELQKKLYDALGGDVSSLTRDDVRSIKAESDRGYLVLTVLQDKLKDTEKELKEFKDVYVNKENIEKQIKKLRKKKNELEYDLLDRENALSSMDKRMLEKSTTILNILNEACKPIQAARPELEVLFESSDSIDQGMSVYILRWAEVLRENARFLEENTKELLPKEIAN
jgi:ParB family chromosome partitioning protein